MKALPLLACVSMALTACTGTPRLIVEPATIASGPDTPVRVALGQTASLNGPSRLPTLLVTVTNTTNADEPFGPENILVSAGDRRVRLYTAEELGASVRKEAAFRRYAAQTRAEMQAQVLDQDPVPMASRSAIEVRANGLQESAAATWAERRALEDVRDLLVPTVLKPGATITRRVVLHPEDLRGVSAVKIAVRLGNADYPFTVRIVS